MIRWRAALTITGAFLLAVGAAAPAARAEDQDGESTSLVTVSDLWLDKSDADIAGGDYGGSVGGVEGICRGESGRESA